MLTFKFLGEYPGKPQGFTHLEPFQPGEIVEVSEGSEELKQILKLIGLFKLLEPNEVAALPEGTIKSFPSPAAELEVETAVIEDEFSGMKKQELLDYADEKGIEVDSASNKATLLAAIRSANQE